MSFAAVFACSHRKDGNSDYAAELLARGVREAGGDVEILHVRDFDVLPCLACGYCDKPGNEGIARCVLGKRDQAWELFRRCFTAKTVLFASPIYFYHLPSRCKTWIDRGQQFWRARQDEEPWMHMPQRTGHAVLLAGQPSGEKLFEGARLTLKYFLHNFNIELADPHTFRAMDAKGDLEVRTDFGLSIVELGRKAWENAD